MKAKTLIELLTLSSNLYLISKDEEFFKRLGEVAEKGKSKFNHLLDEFSEDGEEKLIEKLLYKAKQAKDELEKKVEETAIKVYQKMHIANTDEVKKLSDEIKQVRKELALAEAKLIHLEQKIS